MSDKPPAGPLLIVSCQHCEQRLRARQELAPGARIRCPRCGKVTVAQPVQTLTQAEPPPNLSGDSAQPALPRLPGFRLSAQLGEGAMGVVYKAQDERLHRTVALKMFSDRARAGQRPDIEELRRFTEEARFAARLKHPNIVQIHGLGEHQGQPYLVLEYVEGPTLQMIIQGKPQAPRASAALIAILARAIHLAHTCGIIHRDLKPANILLSTQASEDSAVMSEEHSEVYRIYGVPKIADFGLAKGLGTQPGLGEEGAIIGTPLYMAPEQARSRDNVDARADLYALGAILYEMLTGRPPHIAESVRDVLLQVLMADIVPPHILQRGIPKDLEAVCLKCLAKEPRDRYRNAEDLAEDLERFLKKEPVRARPPSVRERAWRWAVGNPLLVTLLFTLVLGVPFALWFIHWRSREIVIATALHGSRQQADVIQMTNRLYAREVTAKLRARASAEKRDGELEHPAHDGDAFGLLLPAPFTINLCQEITHGRGGDNEAAPWKQGRFRLYSAYPFKDEMQDPTKWLRRAHDKWSRGPRDKFEAEAWEILSVREKPESDDDTDKDGIYRIEEQQGRLVLRYFRAWRLEGGCVKCHNYHVREGNVVEQLSHRKDSTPTLRTKEWKADDVRGILSISYPLHCDLEQTRESLTMTYLLLGLVVVGLALLCGGCLALARRG